MSRIALTAAIILFQCLGALALDVPKLQGRVNDLAGILTRDQLASLDAKLQSFEASDSTQIVVLIVPSLEGDPIEDYSIRVAEAWRIGQKGLDNGAILLVSLRERRLRIEVGYGLEEKLTDARTGQIIRNEIVPRFQQSDFYGGIDAGVDAMIQSVRGIYQSAPETARPPRSSGRFLNWIIVLLFPLLWILSATGKWGGGILGAGVGVLLPYTLIGHSLMLLLIGGAVGSLLGVFLGALVRAGAQSGRGPGGFGGPFFGGGGFGGGGFGGGGFSGGGGGFGGGGSSGRW